MPRQNRVTPHGELLAVPDRGLFWGNQGALLDREGRLALPTGTMVDIGGAPRLVREGRLLAWTPGGYAERLAEPPRGPVTVITPQVTVTALAAGYQPVLHPSAG